MFKVVAKPFPTGSDGFSIDCFITLSKLSSLPLLNFVVKGNKDHFFVKLIILVFQPLIYISFGILLWTVIFLFTKRSVRGEDFKVRALVTSVIIIYILQPGIIEAVFQLFT